jgi:hypothetical protein
MPEVLFLFVEAMHYAPTAQVKIQFQELRDPCPVSLHLRP